MASSDTACPSTLSFTSSSPANILTNLKLYPSLSPLRTLTIVLSETQALTWHGRLWPDVLEVYDDEDMQQFANIHSWPSSTGPWADSATEFRALMKYLADNPDVDWQNLKLEVNISTAMWEVFDTKMPLAYDDDYDNTYRFLYDFAVDVGKALCETVGGKVGKGNVVVETAVWEGLGPWLEREVSGGLRSGLSEEVYGRKCTKPGRGAPPGERKDYWRMPPYHEEGTRLLGDKK